MAALMSGTICALSQEKLRATKLAPSLEGVTFAVMQAHARLSAGLSTRTGGSSTGCRKDYLYLLVGAAFRALFAVARHRLNFQPVDTQVAK